MDGDLAELDPFDDVTNHGALAEMQTLPETRIWGTEINVQSCVNLFSTFLDLFRTSPTDPLSYYERELQRIVSSPNEYVLNINCSHLWDFPSSRSLYHHLLQFPQEIIPVLEHTVSVRLEAMGVVDRRVQVRTFGLCDTVRMRALDPMHVETLVSLKGMVVRCSAVIPDIKQAFFRCAQCAHSLEVLIERGRVDEPPRCPSCQAMSSLEIVHNRCIFTDKQLVRLQETPDEVPEGETPHTVSLFVFDDLVDSVRPGDRMCVTGILRAVPRRANPRQRSVRSVFKTYLDAIHFANINVGKSSSGDSGADRADEEDREAHFDSLDPAESQQTAATLNDRLAACDEVIFADDRVREFLLFASDGRAVEKLVASFAPSVWEMEDVKRGLLCLLFGGTVREKNWKEKRAQLLARARRLLAYESDEVQRTMSELLSVERQEMGEDGSVEDMETFQEEVRRRCEVNVLLCGDPGTSKSQLLAYVHRLSVRGIYTSGKGSSAVGLSASVVRDPETRDSVLESGALVLSDRGVCCIDEFDKMNDSVRAVLHEAMEQQTVSVTKAGVVATLNARAAILAAANPLQSRYNARLSVVENLQLPPTLLSRFDLIFLVLDKPNEDSDRRLARHLVSLYHSDRQREEQRNHSSTSSSAGVGTAAVVDQNFVREYILFCRQCLFPELSPEAQEQLVSVYLEMRSLGGSDRQHKTITATPRQLESLIRLSQALAKMRLSCTVSLSDVQEGARLMRVATQSAATDPRTGTIDMDLITTGRTAFDRELTARLVEFLREMLTHHRGERLTVGQLRMLLAQAQQDPNGHTHFSALTPSMAEMEDAVRELDSEGLVQYIERTQTAIVR